MERTPNTLLVVLIALGISTQHIDAQVTADTNINITAPTGGGKQFWTDRFVHHAWRIQRNIYTGHYRLLDNKDFRWAWGTYEGCQLEFERLRVKNNLPPVRGKVLITIHGLGRSRQSMAGIGEYLAEEGGYTWINVTYASTRDTIDAHARALGQIVTELTQAEEVNFVAHSLGNLVTRRYLTDRAEAPPEMKGPPLGRMVMLAPPNQGAQIAEKLHNNKLFQLVYGLSGRQLSGGWSEIDRQLAIPGFAFGIIAGGRGEGGVDNPLLSGDNDLIVTVEETRLPGAADFLVVPALHTFIMDDPTVRESTLRFLQHGHFLSEASRQPIPTIKPPQ